MTTDRGRPIVSNGKLRRRRKDGWTRTDERTFLSHLRATGNVSGSARAIGRKPSSAYELRDRDPVFTTLWDKAVRESGLRLHSKLIIYAESGGADPVFDDDGEPVDPGLENFDPDLAFRLLKFHADSEAGERRRRLGPTPVSEAELNAALLHRFDQLDRRRARQRING